MHTNERNPQPRPVSRRRRRRRQIRRLGILPACLVFTVSAIFVTSLLEGCAQKNVAEFTESTPSSASAGLQRISAISLDTEAPVITGAQDLEVFAGEAAAYRQGITITDNLDSDPVLDVDSSKVDLSTPGTYPLVYSATDTAGNRSTQEVTVIVRERQNNSVSTNTIYAAADALLEEILSDDMSARQQVQAIYDWTKENLSYGGHSDRTDYEQTAYTMLQEKTGDCYGYFALTKLLFERLDILNVDVQKVHNYEGDSDHFWSLVSLDGGKTYYHFDATPRVGQTEELCLVTDLFLASFDTYHDNCHNRDKSLYPATPEGWS